MKRKSLVLATIIGVAVAIIIAVAINTHLKLSALEPEGHVDESAEEVINEILTGKPSHSETTAEHEEELSHNTNIENSHSE
jgi:hypothetical protein